MLEPSPIERPGASVRDQAERRRRSRLARGDGRSPGIYEENLAKGAAGEERVGTALDTEASSWGGFGVLHSLVLPGGGDIDHIVVGPTGVIVIDSKNWSGDTWIGARGVGQGRRLRAGVVDKMRVQVERVEAVLSHRGFSQVPVRGALCMVNGIRGGGLARIEDIHVGDTSAMLGLVRSPGGLSLAEQRDVFDVLARSFDVRGGKLLPTGSTRVRSEGVTRAEQAARDRALAQRTRMARLRAAGWVVVLMVACGIALLVVGQGGDAHPLSRQAVMAHQGHYRTLARRRAAAPVSGPQVVATPAAFRLLYRGRGACRVTVVVPRRRGPAGAGKPAVRASGCRGGRAHS